MNKNLQNISQDQIKNLIDKIKFSNIISWKQKDYVIKLLFSIDEKNFLELEKFFNEEIKILEDVPVEFLKLMKKVKNEKLENIKKIKFDLNDKIEKKERDNCNLELEKDLKNL